MRDGRVAVDSDRDALRTAVADAVADSRVAISHGLGAQLHPERNRTRHGEQTTRALLDACNTT